MNWSDRGVVLDVLGDPPTALLEQLCAAADALRQERVGDRIHLRGLIEISNHCVAACAYCGLQRSRLGLPRYRMGQEEVIAAARRAAEVGCDTLVMQAGEDPGLTIPWVEQLVRAVREATGLVVTLSLGERLPEELTAWRAAGAGRYLLKFETSNAILCTALRGDATGGRKRVGLLRVLRELGYEVGSGIIVGLPGQPTESLADDLQLMAELQLDMVAIGPFIPGEWDRSASCGASSLGLAPAEAACRMVALARLHCPDANIPATTALKVAAGESGLSAALARGANVVMINVTPQPYRALYEVYPGKGAGPDTADAAEQVRRAAGALHRSV